MLGILVAVIRLNIRLSNLEVLKYHVCGSHLQSGHFYETTRRRILQKYGTNTHIIGVTGFLFEGLTISLGRYLKTVLNTNGNFSSLVLDFFACQGLNESACSQFMKIATFFSEKKKRLFLCHLDKQDEDLLRTWGIESSWVEIVTSLSEVLARLEQETLTGHGAPRPAIDGDTCDMAVLRQSLAQLLGDGPAQEICKKATLVTVASGETLSEEGQASRTVFVAVPGHSDVRLEVRTGTQRRPAKLLQSVQGAICGGEALVKDFCRGTWKAVSKSKVFKLQADNCASMYPQSFPELLAVAYKQQSLETDQLSQLFTLSRGGGWHGVTFDATTKDGCAPVAEMVSPKPRRKMIRQSSAVHSEACQPSMARSLTEYTKDSHIKVAALLPRTMSPNMAPTFDPFESLMPSPEEPEFSLDIVEPEPPPRQRASSIVRMKSALMTGEENARNW